MQLLENLVFIKFARLYNIILYDRKKIIDMPLGLSFTGSRNSYNDTLKKYQRWTDVKDSDNIAPYRATDTSWTPSCANIGRI